MIDFVDAEIIGDKRQFLVTFHDGTQMSLKISAGLLDRSLPNF